MYKNDDVAKFVMLKLPDLGLHFAGEVPHLKQTESVRKIHFIAQRLAHRRALTRRRRLEARQNQRPIDQFYQDCFEPDEDIPF